MAFNKRSALWPSCGMCSLEWKQPWACHRSNRYCTRAIPAILSGPPPVVQFGFLAVQEDVVKVFR